MTGKVEFSRDDLSDTTPTWTDVTTYVRDVRWWSGKASDLDPPQAGGATIILNNADRRFEPDYSAGAYSPDIKPLRRFRLTMTADGTAHTQGVYYAQNWGVGYPARTNYSETTVTCVDGFGILSLDTLPTLTPPGAATYTDVILADGPFAYYPLDEPVGRALNAVVGPQGAYKGVVEHSTPNPVVGDPAPAASFPIAASYARAKLDDSDAFHDSGAVSCEVVFISTDGTGAGSELLFGPFDTAAAATSFGLGTGSCRVVLGAATTITASHALVGGTTPHHYAMTYDGSFLCYYQDGVLVASQEAGGNPPISPDANEYLYIGGDSRGSGISVSTIHVSHAAFYDYALTATQVAAHAAAALTLGYAAQTTGNRVASLATNALWSTAGITGGQTISVAPRFQVGQAKLDEINLTAQAEQPSGLFYFDDSGNPAYQGWDYTATSVATFSDSASDVPYEAITLAYDDDLYNSVTIARDGGDAQTHTDTASESAYMTRGYNQTGLILETDADADLVAADVLTNFSQPRIRVTSITLNSASQTARNQMLTREIGDTIRVKRRTDTGEAIDVITRILGKQKHIGPDGNLTCTWNLSRGIDASDATWHLGVTGYSELNTTTILA